MNTTVTVKLPATFFEDHQSRGCLTGTIIERNANHVTTELDQAAYDDLMSDADYYDDPAEFWMEYRGLVISARATKRALAAVPRPT